MTGPTARGAPSLRPASLAGRDPLRPLPGALLAKLEARRRAGYDWVGADHPRRERWQTVVLPEMLLGAAAAVVLVAALILDHGLLAVVAGAVLAGSAVAAGAGWSWVQADPLRVRRDEQRALDAAGHWESQQPWTPALSAGQERALLAVAVDVAARIAGNPAWRSGYLDGHRLALDLAAELDQIDSQAYAIASARAASARARGSASDNAQAALDGVADRVNSLREYDAGLAALTARIVAADAELNAAPALGELRAGSVQDGYAADGVRRLTDELRVIAASVDSTAAEVRKDRS